jgi:glycosyltransferase involved in cell wall biosynthesis
MEYIFINDCTPDNSMLLLERVLKEYPHRREQVQIITHERNMGLGAARKAGMKAAKGEYVISCDSDDWVEIEMYEKMYTKAVEENADIVCCGFYEEYRHGIKLQKYEKEDKQLMRYLKGGCFRPNVWNKLVRRSLYVERDVYPYDGVNIMEDRGVMVRLLYLSRKTVVLYELFYHYNRQNIHAITAAKWSRTYVNEHVLCAQKLEVFFKEHYAHEEYNVGIQNLKFHATFTLLQQGYYQEWLHLFPEMHRYIWKFPRVSLFRKLFYQDRGLLLVREIPLHHCLVYALASRGIFFPFILRNWLHHKVYHTTV